MNTIDALYIIGDIHMLGRPDDQVTEPLVYAGGLCVNVDGGMYRGGPGFVYRAEPIN